MYVGQLIFGHIDIPYIIVVCFSLTNLSTLLNAKFILSFCLTWLKANYGCSRTAVAQECHLVLISSLPVVVYECYVVDNLSMSPQGHLKVT